MDLDNDELLATKNYKTRFELLKEIEILNNKVQYLENQNKELKRDKEYWMNKAIYK